jgi:hypothetical protein
MGKSSLVEHTLTRPDRVLVAADLRGLDSVEDFIDRLLLRLSTTLEAHRALTKYLPEPLKEALAFIGEVKLSLHGILSVSVRTKPKASTVIRAMDAIERASRWRPLVVFFDEFQEIVENLEERESRHLLGVLRAEIQRHTHVAYLFAGSARGSMLDLFTAERSHFYQSAAILDVGPIPQATWRNSSRSNSRAVNANFPATRYRQFLLWPASRLTTSSNSPITLWTQSTCRKRPFELLLPQASRPKISSLRRVRNTLRFQDTSPLRGGQFNEVYFRSWPNAHITPKALLPFRSDRRLRHAQC